jgi:hypothetical protein
VSDQHNKTYSSLSQRVADSFAQSLSHLEPKSVVPEGAADLHAFFVKWYEEMATTPESFGLLITEDMCITDEDNGNQAKKALVSQRVKKIRESVGNGLELLMLAGEKGKLQDNSILLKKIDWDTYLVKEPRLKKAMLKGLEQVGMTIIETSEGMILQNDQYPHMMPALRNLVEGYSQIKDESVALFHLSRCDFNAQAANYQPDPTDLYRVFSEAEYERLMTLHRYLISKNFKFILHINGIHGWEIKYQGNRRVKSSHYLHVEYSMRRQNPLVLRLKIASANRLAPLIEIQSQRLQDGFFKRVYHCQGAKCGWCKNQKSLGPSKFNYKGKQYVICWYSNPNLSPLDDAAVDLVKEFTEIHEQLVALK